MSPAAAAGGLRSQSTNVRRASHADTTIGAVISVPSVSVTAATPSAPHTIPATGLDVRSTPPWWVKAAARASVRRPLPPTGRPTWDTWRIAYGSAPRPVPEDSGLTPQTTGPETRPGPSMASVVKKERITDAALRRLHLNTVGTPARR